MKKSLLDIQHEIRELKGKVKDISTAIVEIYDEIDELRNDETLNAPCDGILFFIESNKKRSSIGMYG